MQTRRCSKLYVLRDKLYVPVMYLLFVYFIVIIVDEMGEEAIRSRILEAVTSDNHAAGAENSSSCECEAAASGNDVRLLDDWQRGFSIVDLSFNVVFLFEILLCLVIELSKIEWHSCDSLLLLDFVAIATCLSTSVYSLAVSSSNSTTLSIVGSFVRFVRIFRLVRVLLEWRQRQSRSQKLVRMESWKMEQKPLCWTNGPSVKLPPPLAGASGFHLFISHQWQAQDLAGRLKSRLMSCEIGCRTFLDVDDLDHIELLEMYIERSDVILIILTDAYLQSKNCRRELTHAMKTNKRIVVLLETDADKGKISSAGILQLTQSINSTGLLPSEHYNAALHLHQLVKEHEEQVRCQTNLEFPLLVNWHRELLFRQVVFKLITAHILKVHEPTSPARRNSALRNSSEATQSIGEAGYSERSMNDLAEDSKSNNNNWGAFTKPPFFLSMGTASTPAKVVRQPRVVSLLQFKFSVNVGRRHDTSDVLDTSRERLLYMDAGYRDVLLTHTPAKSVFSLLEERLAPWNVTLVDKHPAVINGLPQIGAPPMVLFLCSALFDTEHTELCGRIATVMTAQKEKRQRRGSGTMANLTHSMSKSMRRMSVGMTSTVSVVRDENTTTASVDQNSVAVTIPPQKQPQATKIIYMYWAEVPFSYYINRCPAYLKELHFFDPLWEKFPVQYVLQQAACQDISKRAVLGSSNKAIATNADTDADTACQRSVRSKSVHLVPTADALDKYATVIQTMFRKRSSARLVIVPPPR